MVKVRVFERDFLHFFYIMIIFLLEKEVNKVESKNKSNKLENEEDDDDDEIEDSEIDNNKIREEESDNDKKTPLPSFNIPSFNDEL